MAVLLVQRNLTMQDLRSFQRTSLQLGNWSPLLLMIGDQSRHRNSTFSNGAATKKFDGKLVQTAKGGGACRWKFCRKFISIGSNTLHRCAVTSRYRRLFFQFQVSICCFTFISWCNGKPQCDHVVCRVHILSLTCLNHSLFQLFFRILEKQNASSFSCSLCVEYT